MNPIDVTTSQFLAALFREIPEGALIEIRAEQPDGTVVRRWATSPVEVLNAVKPLTESVNIWFGPGLRMRRGGTNADVGWITSLWVDADAKLFPNGTKEEAYKHIMRYRLKPSIIVDSGHGLQPYWLLKEVVQTEDIPLLIGAMRSLNAELSEGLPKEFDIVAQASRMMRLPNTWNRKDIAEPVMARVIVFDPDSLYDLSDFPINPIRIPTIIAPYERTEFALDDDVPPVRELLALAQSRNVEAWAINALHRPDDYDRGDASNLDYSVMRELVKVLTPAECQYVWMNTTLGKRSKVQQRQDYRERTIWRARQSLIDKGEAVYTPETDNGGVGIIISAADGGDDVTGPSNYRHTWSGGLELLGRRTTLLANFRPVLLREVEVVHEDGENQREYEVELQRVQNDPNPVTFRLTGSDVESERAFRKRVAPLLPAAFIVYPSGWVHLLPAMFELALDNDYIRERTYASTGWVTDVTPPAFILPGAEGGIDANGLNEAYRFDTTSLQHLPERLKRYGEGVRPTYDSGEREVVEDALIQLLYLAPAEVVIPIVTQVLAGPLSSIGARNVPPLVHILGRTGSFKTTLSLLCLSLMGKFEQGSVPETWTSTQNALIRRLYEMRDLTLLIDDYKRMKQEPVTLIQNYADSSTRARMGADQENRVSLVPRGILLSTGEDVWDEHESTEARTIIVTVRRPDAHDLSEFLQRLTELQEKAKKGYLSLVGGDWLAWLSSCGLDVIESAYYTYRLEWMKTVGQQNSDIHLRLASTMAALFAVGDVVQQFLDNYYPRAALMYAECKAEAWQSLIGTGIQRAEEATVRSPYQWVISTLQDAMARHTIHFTHRLVKMQTMQRILGQMGTDSVGYYDDEHVYLSEHGTFDWIRAKARQAGYEIPFSWRAFRQGARDALGPYIYNGEDKRINFFISPGNKGVNCVVIPRSLFEVGPASENPQEQMKQALEQSLQEIAEELWISEQGDEQGDEKDGEERNE